VVVSGLTDAVAISVGVGEACAVRRGGQVMCWGMNEQGQLGDGVATHDSCNLGVDGPIDCSRVPVTVAALTDAVEVSVSSGFVCARRAGGGVMCWGMGTLGVLGNGEMTASPTPVAVSGVTDATAIRSGVFNTCTLRASGAVSCWGWDDTGMLGDGSATHQACDGALTGCSPRPVTVTGLSDATALAGRWGHACAARASGAVVCWGDDSHQELGDGSAAPETSPGPQSTSPLTVANVTRPVAITANSFSSCALASDCSVACWGYNAYGQLGDGSMTDRATAVNVVGL
jgi:alpha-tubulin suppressor-like RCC1 family protein